jgi:hypothetical protein
MTLTQPCRLDFVSISISKNIDQGTRRVAFPRRISFSVYTTPLHSSLRLFLWPSLPCFQNLATAAHPTTPVTFHIAFVGLPLSSQFNKTKQSSHFHRFFSRPLHHTHTSLAIMEPLPGLAIPCVYYIEDFLDDASNTIFELLRTSVKWEKTTKINRWVALYGEVPLEPATDTYRYRDQPSQGMQPWTKELLAIKTQIEAYYLAQTQTTVDFNVCLLNMYENGHQAIGWHADR